MRRRIMRRLKRWWGLFALVAVAAAVSICYVARSRAFILVELDEYLPAVQLVANQTVAINVSNLSANSVSANVQVLGGDGGTLVSQQLTLQPGQTIPVIYTNTPSVAGAASPAIVRGVVTLPNGGHVVSDMTTFDVNTGEIIAILPPAIQRASD
jgi:FtsP/CotA-like multicopper oxidase with cupredoxin domain